jgi:hypothetical protein
MDTAIAGGCNGLQSTIHAEPRTFGDEAGRMP